MTTGQQNRGVTAAWVTCALASSSVVVSAAIVLNVPDARSQLLTLDFPLTKLGESTLYMVAPIVLSAAALLTCIPSLVGKARTLAAATTFASWVVLVGILGDVGFRYLF